jgi:hypothetical protein
MVEIMELAQSISGMKTEQRDCVQRSHQISSCLQWSGCRTMWWRCLENLSHHALRILNTPQKGMSVSILPNVLRGLVYLKIFQFLSCMDLLLTEKDTHFQVGW